jgi:PAS domain-containing protein
MGENECLYKRLFINNRAIILLINPETSEILDCSFSACSFYGYSYEEMLNLINDLSLFKISIRTGRSKYLATLDSLGATRFLLERLHNFTYNGIN